MKRKPLDTEGSEKLQRIYWKYRLFLLGVAFPILKDKALAEDAVHDTVEKLIGNLHKVDESNEAATRKFLSRICRNAAIDIYDKKLSLNQNVDLSEELDLIQNEYAADLLSGYINKETREILIDEVKALDPKQREVFFMRVNEERSYEDIAKTVEAEPATVRKWMERTRAKLAMRLKKEMEV